MVAAARFGFRPDAPTGHFQRHVDGIFGTEVPGAYHMEIPGHCKNEATRTLMKNVVVCPHERIDDEVRLVGDDRMTEGVKKKVWPETYWENAVVRDCQAKGQELPVPLALYVDGVPYTKTGSFVAFWITNLVTSQRNLVALLRKSDFCRCGCRGWCSLYPVLLFLSWSLKAMASGMWPCRRHDGADWQGEDENRRR